MSKIPRVGFPKKFERFVIRKEEVNTLKKILTLIKDGKGASLLIVLASLLFLVIIASSTLISALGAVSVTQNQKEKTQIDLFAESVQMSVFEMLNEDTPGTPGGTTFQDEIAESVVNYTADPTNLLYSDFTITITETLPDTTTVDHSFACKLDLSELTISGGNEIGGVLWIDATIDLDPAEIDPATEAVYRIGYRTVTDIVINPGIGTVNTYGTWSLTTYEKIDN